jgi:hypothetical protein
VQETLINECVIYAPGNRGAGGDEPLVGCPCGAVLLEQPKNACVATPNDRIRQVLPLGRILPRPAGTIERPRQPHARG